MTPGSRRSAWSVLALLVGVVAYYLPWFDHFTAGFTTHGYDLAEWTSLHPAVRASSPPLLTSFLLRWPQVALVFALALAANWLGDARARWLLRAAAALLALRFAPPAEFFGGASDDPNYRQMALLTAIGLAGVAAAIAAARLPRAWHVALFEVGAISGPLVGWWGLSRAEILMDNFEIDVTIGVGPALLTLVTLVVILLAILPERPRDRRQAAQAFGR